MRCCEKHSWVMITPALVLALSLPVASVSATPVQAPPTVAATSQQTAPARLVLASRPDVRSHSFYVFDESTSSVLAARNERVAVPVASITKLMTALVVLDAGQSMQQTLTITADDVRGTAGNASRLPVGARLSRADLLRLALMSSENRAAQALCRNYPKGLAACVKAMNKKAAELQMATARFVDPTGLSSGNVASAADLAKLVIAAAGNPQISAHSTAARHTVTVNRRAIEFRNTNLLVENPGWQVDVQKTGYIAEAGRCLVMQTVIDRRAVVIVLLNSWGKYTRIADAKRIRTWMETQTRVAAL
jgi:D-alanyl-D-alanine endopeptidase (penicillin-binding protein 7)